MTNKQCCSTMCRQYAFVTWYHCKFCISVDCRMRLTESAKCKHTWQQDIWKYQFSQSFHWQWNSSARCNLKGIVSEGAAVPGWPGVPLYVGLHNIFILVPFPAYLEKIPHFECLYFKNVKRLEDRHFCSRSARKTWKVIITGMCFNAHTGQCGLVAIIAA